MTNVIYNITKRNVLLACLVASVLAVVYNVTFGMIGGLMFADHAVNVANNVVDLIQLAVYVATKLTTFKKLDRYDSPFILASLVSLAF